MGRSLTRGQGCRGSPRWSRSRGEGGRERLRRRGRSGRSERQRVRRRECGGRARRKEGIETDGRRVDAGGGFARIAVLIVDLDKLNIRELFEVDGQRARDGIERAVRLAVPGEVDVRDAVGIFESAVAGEAVEDEREPGVAFHVAGTFEEFVQRRPNEVLGGRDEARHRDLVRQFTIDEPFVIGKVDVHPHEQRRARRRGSARDGRRETWRKGGRDRGGMRGRARDGGCECFGRR